MIKGKREKESNSFPQWVSIVLALGVIAFIIAAGAHFLRYKEPVEPNGYHKFYEDMECKNGDWKHVKYELYENGRLKSLECNDLN